MKIPYLSTAIPAAALATLSVVVVAAALSPLPAQAAQTASPVSADAAVIAKITVPAPKREFRGVWVATVENIDWPSKPGLSTDQQKAELVLLMDRAVALHLNAVLLQVRPACDALYDSPLEPWSEYLTGQMGKAPEPYYDPLTFAVAEAHKRGLELHAWFNPFRARQKSASGTASANHVSKTHPEWVREYGKLQWLDPGVKAARDHSLAVVLDMVRRYDLDGVHMDDYFYPYKEVDKNKKEIPFPDDEPFDAYVKAGGTLNKSDWRRSNIDDLVERLYREVKDAKPWVKVGISPFGIWRPNNPYQIKGFDSYEQLSGDSRRWLHEGWGDYFTPQLYWRIEQTPQSFPVLLNWWIGENTQNRHIWPGLYAGLADGTNAKWPQEEIEYQIKTTRGFSGSTGAIHFSANFLLTNDTPAAPSLATRLKQKVYAEQTLVPASPWLGSPTDVLPAAPLTVEVVPAPPGSPAGWIVRWKPDRTAPVAPWQWAVQWRAGGEMWSQSVLPGGLTGTTEQFIPAPVPPTPPKRGADKPKPPPPAAVAVTAVDRIGRVSAAQIVLLPPLP